MRGGNSISLVSMLLRLQPELLIKLSSRYFGIGNRLHSCQNGLSNGKVLPARPATSAYERP